MAVGSPRSEAAHDACPPFPADPTLAQFVFERAHVVPWWTPPGYVSDPRLPIAELLDGVTPPAGPVRPGRTVPPAAPDSPTARPAVPPRSAGPLHLAPLPPADLSRRVLIAVLVLAILELAALFALFGPLAARPQ